jgi:hypothetical protein
MKLNNIYITCMALLVLVMLSCSKMNDLSDKYLKKGEIIYAAKVDSVAAHTGNKRIQLEMKINSQRIETVRIFWNDYTDSTDFLVGSQTGTFKEMIENLAERSYIFEFESIDKFGNRSLPFEATGNVYGDAYISTLITRTCTFLSSNAGIVLKFSTVPDGNVATIVTYTNTSGVLSSINIPDTVNSYVITDRISYSGSPISLKSSYIPKSAVDTFYSAGKSVSGYLKFDQKDWKIKDYSDQYSDGDNAVTNIIDGTDGTRWHTSPSGSYPHYATIDMGAVRTISKIGVWRTTFDGGGDNRAPTRIQFLISNDNATWTDLGQYDFNNLINGEQDFPLATLAQGRYLKFVGLAGTNQFMTLGEICAYGL